MNADVISIIFKKLLPYVNMVARLNSVLCASV